MARTEFWLGSVIAAVAAPLIWGLVSNGEAAAAHGKASLAVGLRPPQQAETPAEIPLHVPAAIPAEDVTPAAQAQTVQPLPGTTAEQARVEAARALPTLDGLGRRQRLSELLAGPPLEGRARRALLRQLRPQEAPEFYEELLVRLRRVDPRSEVGSALTRLFDDAARRVPPLPEQSHVLAALLGGATPEQTPPPADAERLEGEVVVLR
jgi:hypothetical protein